MKPSNIVKSLNELNEKDIYSMMLFALYKLSEDPQYSTLCEMIYLVDKDSLMKLLSVFEGLTVKVPKVSELKTLVSAMDLYRRINIDGSDYAEAYKAVKTDDVAEDEVKAAYAKMCDVLAKYDFSRK